MDIIVFQIKHRLYIAWLRARERSWWRRFWFGVSVACAFVTGALLGAGDRTWLPMAIATVASAGAAYYNIFE